MPGKHRAVSTAKKRAEYARENKPWPKYPDGKNQKWKPNARMINGGSFLSWNAAQNDDKSTQTWRKKNPEKIKEHARRSWRKYAGISEHCPVMTRDEIVRKGTRVRGLKRAVAQDHVMNVIQKNDPYRAKLMRLSVNEGASPAERRRALEKLDLYNNKSPHQEEKKWQHSQTTSAGTPTQQLALKSTSS